MRGNASRVLCACILGMFAAAVFADAAGAHIAMPSPATQVTHLAGFQAHDVGLAPYGTFAHDHGPAGGGSPSKKPALDIVASHRLPGLAGQGTIAAGPALGPEVPSFRTEFSRTYVSPKGGYVARIYGQPVNYRAPDGSLEPIDDTLVASGAGFTNRADSQHVFLPRDMSSGAVSVSSAGGTISFRLEGAAAGTVSTVGSAASFKNVLPGVSLDYGVSSGQLREAIQLASAAVPATLRFDVSLSAGLTPTLTKSDVTEIRDDKGEIVFTIPAPTMNEDGTPSAPPASSGGHVAVSLTRSGQGWVFSLTPDSKYLHSPNRTFPVTIDPTVNGGNATTDCEIASGAYATGNYCTYNITGVGASVPGYNSSETSTVMQVPLSGIPADSEILQAVLETDVYQVGAAPFYISAYGLTRPFTSGVTWNTYDGTHSWTTGGGDRDATPTWTGTISGAGWNGFPMTALVQSWLDGSRQNDGVVLAPGDPLTTNEATLYGTGPTGIYFSGDPNPPYMDVSYLPRSGDLRGATINRTSLTDRMSVGVNVANGNLLVHNSDLSVPGAGLDQTVARTYNNLSPYSYEFGYGWTSTAGGEPNLSGAYDGIIPTLPDGSQPVFADDGNGGYITPPGVDATLCSNATIAGCPGLPSGATFLLSYRDGTRQSFDANGGLISATDQNNNSLAYSFSSSLGPLVTTTDTQGRTFSFTDSGNLITSISDNSYPGGRQTSYGYTSGMLTSYVDANGKQTSYGYDGADNLDQITDPNGDVTKFTFDGSGRVLTMLRITNALLGTGDTTTYTYGAPGDVTGCAAAPGGAVPYGKTTVTDAKSNATLYCYDTHDRVYYVRDALGNTRATTYTTDDNVVKFNDPTGDTFTSNYDTLDRPCSGAEPPSASGQNAATDHLDYVTVPSGPSTDPCLHNTAPQNSTTHNPNYPDFARDPQGNEDSLGYDANSNLNAITEVSTGIGVHLGYNVNGTLSWSKDGNGNQTNYTYFAAGDPNGHPSDLKSVTPPAPLAASSYTYDPISRVHTYTDGKNQTTTYQYDKLDRITEVDYADGSSIKYTYDNDGNTLKIIDSVNGTSNYAFDAKNRILQEQLATGQTNNYTYDADDNLSTLSDAGGTTTYGYDADNHNTSVLPPGASTATTLTYDANDRAKCETYPNGIVIQNTYQPGGELSETVALKPGASCATIPTGTNKLADYKYTYANGANDTLLRRTMTTLAGTTISYAYDTFNRLTAATSAADNRSYMLDPAGNITRRTINGAVTSMAYNGANEICWTVSATTSNLCGATPSGATTYAFDANGNELSNSAGLSFTYNARNQTTNITSGGTGNALHYLGGSQGILTSIGAMSVLNNLVGISGQTSSGTTYDSRTVNGGLLDERTPTGTYTYLQDGLGSTIGLANSAGTLVNTAAYDPYGQITASTGTTPNPFGYASGLQVPGGLIKYGERYYDPSIGRWTQQDPLAQAGGADSAYAYSADDPVSEVDPSGLLDTEAIAKECIVGGAQSTVLSGPEDALGGCAFGAGAETAKELGCDVCGTAINAVGNISDVWKSPAKPLLKDSFKAGKKAFSELADAL
jgi:RHS repeat-associated protein